MLNTAHGPPPARILPLKLGFFWLKTKRLPGTQEMDLGAAEFLSLSLICFTAAVSIGRSLRS